MGPRVEELALPKSVESFNFILTKVVIPWISVKIMFYREGAGNTLSEARSPISSQGDFYAHTTRRF
jgi:hypothetical protein